MTDELVDDPIIEQPNEPDNEDNSDLNIINVRTESDTHIGIEKKAGGWLENQCANIIEFAGFTTEREVKIQFDTESTDHYRIDVLGKYEKLTIFLEAKDYNEMKIDSKILFTLIGQINHYRLKHPDEDVVGILATSAKNIEGINNGVERKLESEGCYLWDGLKIQSFLNNISQYRNGEEFRDYLLHEIEYFKNNSQDQEITDLKKGKPRFFCRAKFYSIPEMQYIGNMFHFNSIIGDLKNQLVDTKIDLIKTRYGVFKDISGNNRFYFMCDFELSKTEEDIQNHAEKNKGSWFSRNKLSSTGLMTFDFTRACKKVIENTYGIEKEYDLNYPVKIITTRSDILGEYVKHND